MFRTGRHNYGSYDEPADLPGMGPLCGTVLYTRLVQKITFGADEAAIERARELARSEGKTLGEAFREWLQSYASRVPEQYLDAKREDIRALFERLSYVRAGRKFTRDEMNER